MKTVNLQTGQYEDLPEDQAQAAFQAGTHTVEKDQLIPVRAPDGQMYTIPGSSAADAVQQGATFVPHEEYRKADLEARRGGLGNTLAAGAEGVARGLTVGLSDPIAIKVAQLMGKGEEVRTHLAEEKEAHPYVSGGGEILGAALPALATGGMTAEVEAGAEAAQGGGRIAQLLRTIGAPARAVSGAGEEAAGIASRAMELVTGTPAAESAMGRIARMAIKQGATGAAEGLLFGAGNEISEDSLGNHELNAEKLVSALGHGALYGAMLGTAAGGGLTAAKETFGSILTKAAPYIERQADEQAVRAFNPMKPALRKMRERGISSQELGETAREFGITPSNPLEAARTGPMELLERTMAAKDMVGKKIAAIVDGSQATIPAEEILAPLRARIEGMEKTAAGKDAAGQLRTFYDQLSESLGVPKGEPAPKPVTMTIPERVQRTPQEIADYLQAHPGVKFKASGMPPDEAIWKTVTPHEAPPIGPHGQGSGYYESQRIAIKDIVGNTEPYSAEKAAAVAKRRAAGEATGPIRLTRDDDGRLVVNDGIHRLDAARKAGESHIDAMVEAVPPEMRTKPLEVPVSRLIEERRALQRRLFQDIRTNQVRWPIDEMRQFTGELGDIEEKAIDKASHALGSDQGQALKAANKDYQKLSYLHDLAEQRVDQSVANRKVSLSSMMAGTAMGAGSIAAGHPLGMVKGIAAAAGHQMLLERGNAVASAMLGKIAKLDLVARATSAVDSEIDGAVKAFVQDSPKPLGNLKVRLRRFGGQSQGQDVHKQYDDAYRQSAANPAAPAQLGMQHVDKALPGFSQHAPKTSIALATAVGKGAAYLATQRPPDATTPSLLGGPPRPNGEAAQAWLRKAQAVEDPVGTLSRGLETGKISSDEIDAIAATKPLIYRQFQEKLLDEVAAHKDKMSYDKVMTLSRVLRMSLDPSLTPQAVAAAQQVYQQPLAKPQQTPAAPKRKIQGFAKDATLSTGQVEPGR